MEQKIEPQMTKEKCLKQQIEQKNKELSELSRTIMSIEPENMFLKAEIERLKGLCEASEKALKEIASVTPFSASIAQNALRILQTNNL